MTQSSASPLSVHDGAAPNAANGPARLPATALGVPAPHLLLVSSPQHPHSEKLRSLRTELLLRCDDNNRASVIAVVSSGHGEGRSQLAAELAIGFAQLGRPTLLLDADLRHPRQHQLFGVDNERGLSQLLAHEQVPTRHPVSGLPQLALYTAGVGMPHPTELLSSSRFDQAMSGWRLEHDFIVVDTSPLSRYADALAVANLARRALVLSRADHTPLRATAELLRQLASTRAQILGAVINHF